MAKFDVNRYARLGAEARAAELSAELAEIYRAFPGLRRGRPAAGGAAGSEDAPARRHRKPMSAAQKRAVSIRMKKYWANRRKAKAQE